MAGVTQRASGGRGLKTDCDHDATTSTGVGGAQHPRQRDRVWTHRHAADAPEGTGFGASGGGWVVGGRWASGCRERAGSSCCLE